MKPRTFCLPVLLLLAFLLGIYVSRSGPDAAFANSNSSIPQSFGSCRGAMGSELLIFEDSFGTVRLVHPASGMVFGTVSRK